MENQSSDYMKMLMLNIKRELMNDIIKDFKEEFEGIIIDVLMRKEILKSQQEPSYLFEKDLIKKYNTSKTFLHKVMKQHPIERVKSGRFYMYSEASYLEACKNYRCINKPTFGKKAA